MNKKALLALLLVGVLAFGAGMGTVAYYTQTFNSGSNQITTADWQVSANGLLSTTANFEVDGNNIAPGRSGVEEFSIDKTGTEVAVEYRMTITTSKVEGTENDEFLFRDGTPVILNLVKYDDEGNYEVIYGNVKSGMEYLVIPNDDNTKYGIEYAWPWETSNVNDIEFAGNTANITLNVEARQIRDGGIVTTMYFRDQSVNPRYTNHNATVVVYVDENNVPVSLYGFDPHFGEFTWDGNTIKSSNITPPQAYGWQYAGLENGKYVWKANGQKLWVELSPNKLQIGN